MNCPSCGEPSVEDRGVCGVCHSVMLPPNGDPIAAHNKRPMGRALIALGLNFFVLPGVGSLVGGAPVGKMQVALSLIGLALVLLFRVPIAALLLAAMWVWGIVTAVQLVDTAAKAKAARTPAHLAS